LGDIVMATIDGNTNQKTIESISNVHRKLSSIPDQELDAMEEEDQIKHADSLHNADMVVLELETAQLKEVNDAFKNKEQELKEAALSLENDLSELTEATQIINVVSKGLVLVTDIVKLLA
jgi:hypothetical protein